MRSVGLPDKLSVAGSRRSKVRIGLPRSSQILMPAARETPSACVRKPHSAIANWDDREYHCGPPKV